MNNFFDRDENQAVEVDGISFETVILERNIAIPPKQNDAKTSMKFGVKITNQTDTPRYFLLFAACPEFFKLDQTKIFQSGPNSYRTYPPQFYHFQLIQSQKTTIFWLEGYFHWFKNKLEFAFMRNDGVWWGFSEFELGTYLIQVIYENPYLDWRQTSWSDNLDLEHFAPFQKQETYHSSFPNPVNIENVWTDKVTTTPIEFCLV